MSDLLPSLEFAICGHDFRVSEDGHPTQQTALLAMGKTCRAGFLVTRPQGMPWPAYLDQCRKQFIETTGKEANAWAGDMVTVQTLRRLGLETEAEFFWTEAQGKPLLRAVLVA